MFLRARLQFLMRSLSAPAILLGLLAWLTAAPAIAQTDPPPTSPQCTCAEAPASGSAPSQSLTQTERRQILSAIEQGEEETEAPLSGVDDGALVATVLRHAHTELGQRVRPSQIDPVWAIEPPVRDVVAEFATAHASGGVGQWLAGLRSSHAGYRSLSAERCRYLQLVEAGGWPQVGAGRPLKAGDEDPALLQLRARLIRQGYELTATATPERFDADLSRALMLFQQRNGLSADGILGPATRQTLNLTAKARLAQIEANLERWRWLPRDLPADRIEVDIAAAKATPYAAGTPGLQMRVVVGDPGHRTPMFATQVEAVIFNPPWNVPASIASKELLPKAARDPGYLTRNGFERRDGRLVQRPGPSNALGRLKFDFPSPFGVYLHDTPGQAAFARPVRTLSHGCIRLEKPRELTEILLASEGWTRFQIDGAIEAGTTRRVAVQPKKPLYLVYRTAFIDEEGALNFLPDVYGWDAKLLSALASAAAAQPTFAPRLDSECSAATHD